MIGGSLPPPAGDFDYRAVVKTLLGWNAVCWHEVAAGFQNLQEVDGYLKGAILATPGREGTGVTRPSLPVEMLKPMPKRPRLPTERGVAREA